MTDYREKYEELLKINSRLKEEIESLKRIPVSGKNLGMNGLPKIEKIPGSILEELVGSVSSYLSLFSVDGDNRIMIHSLNEKASAVEKIKRKETEGKYIDQTRLAEKKILVRLIDEVYRTGETKKVAVSEMGKDSEGQYIALKTTSGRILVTWEPGMNQKNEDDFNKQHKIFEQFAEMLPQMIYEVDIKGRITYANSQGLKFFGYTKEDLSCNLNISDVFPENYKKMIENLVKLTSPEQITSNEYTGRRKDGTLVPILTHSFAVFQDNKIIGYRGVVTDISKHRNYEDQINREKAFLENLIDSMPEAIVLIDKNGKIAKINKEFSSLFGYSADESINRNIDDLIIPEDLREEAVSIDSLTDVKGKTIKQTTRRDKAGNKIQVSLVASGIKINNEIVSYLGIYRDISLDKKNQTIQEILYNISTAALNQLEIKDIYLSIVNELSKIWDTNNFFIALYDKKNDTLSMPFFADESDKFENVPARQTITKWVISLKKPVLLKLNDLKDLENSGDIALVGTPCKVWMGVPLKADKEIIGVMALQDYHDEEKFSQEDVNVLEFIANQIAIAIQRRTMLDNVLQASRKAEEAAQSKQQFMSTMSHEIRTPLNEVIGITNLLLQGNPREDQMDFIKTLRFSGNHLLTLVNDVLDYNKMESGKIVFEQTKFNLDDFLKDIQRTYSFRSKSKSLEFDIIRENTLPSLVSGDPIRLNQILSNLLSNALKFTQKGSIFIILREIEKTDGSSRIEFRVKDTGLGIPREKHDFIFESFTQASADTTRHYGGTGLGLAICKKLVELQGGNISVQSEPNKGSVFIFDLTFGIPENGEKAPAVETYESYTGLEGKKILVAEDNKINFFVANKFLTGWGVKVTHAENGKIALDILANEEFDLIIMDLHMPVMDGVEATRVIRNSEESRIRNIPVIALTAAIMSESHDKIEDLSINDYVLKPFKPRDLFDKILRNIK